MLKKYKTKKQITKKTKITRMAVMQRKRMDYDMFIEMVRQRKLGVSARQVCKNLGINRGMIERWWHKDEEEFLAARVKDI